MPYRQIAFQSHAMLRSVASGFGIINVVTTQDALKHLACLGNNPEVGMLSIVYQQPEEAMHVARWEAVRAGLIVHQGSRTPAIGFSADDAGRKESR